MEVLLGVSNRHIHITKEDYQILFGMIPLEVERYLVQKGEFASTQFVTVKVGKNVIEHVRILGPFRAYTQFELSKTDARHLKIDPPIRTSGDLKDAEKVTIIGPKGQITRCCAIIANRHIHINHEMRSSLGWLDVQKVSVSFKSQKGTTFHDVFIKEQENAVLELHLDTDDANGSFLKTGDIGEVIVP